MTFAKLGFAAILIAMAAPAAAQTTDELKARVAALEQENAKLHEALASHRAPSGPRKTEARAAQALATTTLPAAVYAKGAAAAVAGQLDRVLCRRQCRAFGCQERHRLDPHAQHRWLWLDSGP
jgi:hypothetical protein